MCCSRNASVKPVEILHLSFLTVYICFAYTLHHQDLGASNEVPTFFSFSFLMSAAPISYFILGTGFPPICHTHTGLGRRGAFEPRRRRDAWIKLSYQRVWAKAGGGMKRGVQRNDKFIDKLSDLQIPNNA